MIKCILLLVITFFSIVSMGQEVEDKYSQLIDSAIILQINTLGIWEKEIGITLIDRNNQPYFLRADTLRSRFKSISFYSRNGKRDLKNGKRVWKVIPLLERNKLVIQIIDFNVYYKKRGYQFVNGGGATVVFEYSCSSNQWNLVKSKWSGL